MINELSETIFCMVFALMSQINVKILLIANTFQISNIDIRSRKPVMSRAIALNLNNNRECKKIYYVLPFAVMWFIYSK